MLDLLIDSIAQLALLFGGLIVAVVIYLFTWLPKSKTSIDSDDFELEYAYADKSPIEDIFLDYRHKDVDQWSREIKSRSVESRDKAIKLLKDYLNRPINRLGSITREVLRAFVLLDLTEYFDVIANFVQKIKRTWEGSMGAGGFYRDGMHTLILLNPKQAKDICARDIRESANLNYGDELRKFALMAITQIKNPEELSEIYAKIVLENDFPIDFKLSGLEMLKTDRYRQVAILVEILSRMVKGQAKDFMLFSHCFKALLDFDDGSDPHARAAILECVSHVTLADEATRILQERLFSEDFHIDQKTLFQILNRTTWKNYLILKKALIARNKCNESEEELIDQADEYEKTGSHESLAETAVNILSFTEALDVPGFMAINFSKLETCMSNINSNGVKVIVSSEDSEKLFLMKAYASHQKKSLIVVDLEKLMLSPDSIDRLDYDLASVKNKIIYLIHSKDFLEEYLNNKSSIRIEKIVKIVSKHASRQSCLAAISIDQDIDDIKKYNKNLYDLVASEISEFFTGMLHFKGPNESEKKAIFKDLKRAINKERNSELDGFDEIHEATKGFSRFKYLNFTLKFLKLSLLSYGEIMRVKSYLKLLENANEEEQEEVLSP